jgi:hypothetical protein
MRECIVCQRIPAKTVFKYTHKVFDEVSDKEKVHVIAREACEIINYADKKNRIFFCGKSAYSILSGLLYILSRKHEANINQRDVASKFPKRKSTYKALYYPTESLTEVTVRVNFHRWLKTFPELFKDVDFARQWWHK